MKRAAYVVLTLLYVAGVLAIGAAPITPASPQKALAASSSVWWVGASSTDSSALPNTGVRATIQVISTQVTGCLTFWVGDDLSNNVWGQVGYYICDSATPTAFYQIWNLNTNAVLSAGTSSVATGSHTFSMYLQSGTTWAYALDGSVFGTYDMGASSSSSSYAVQALSEEQATSVFSFPAVTFSTAMQVMKSGSWSSVQTATSYGTAWGVQGNAQNSNLQSDQIVVGGSLSSLPQGTALWGTSSTSTSTTSSTTSTNTMPPVTSTVTQTTTSTVTATQTVTTTSTSTKTLPASTTTTTVTQTLPASTTTTTATSTQTVPASTTTTTTTQTTTTTITTTVVPTSVTQTQTQTSTTTSTTTVITTVTSTSTAASTSTNAGTVTVTQTQTSTVVQPTTTTVTATFTSVPPPLTVNQTSTEIQPTTTTQTVTWMSILPPIVTTTTTTLPASTTTTTTTLPPSTTTVTSMGTASPITTTRTATVTVTTTVCVSGNNHTIVACSSSGGNNAIAPPMVPTDIVLISSVIGASLALFVIRRAFIATHSS